MNAVRHHLHRQRGVVLIFSLIVLLILTLGAVGLMRSMNNSLFTAGNLAFRRDIVNQGEQALSNVIAQFKTGGAMVGLTTADNVALNYKSTMLPTNAQGVPLALLNSTTFATVGTSANDIVGAATGSTEGVTIRYVIDRLCSATGTASSALCVQSSANPTGGSSPKAPPPPNATVYRLSVRVTGPRNTQAFLQSTFTMPGS